MTVNIVKVVVNNGRGYGAHVQVFGRTETGSIVLGTAPALQPEEIEPTIAYLCSKLLETGNHVTLSNPKKPKAKE